MVRGCFENKDFQKEPICFHMVQHITDVFLELLFATFCKKFIFSNFTSFYFQNNHLYSWLIRTNPFQFSVFFLFPLKTSSFLTCSGEIKRKRCSNGVSEKLSELFRGALKRNCFEIGKLLNKQMQQKTFSADL